MRCVHCSSRIQIGSPACPHCGRPRPQLAQNFERAENQFLSLRSRLQAGQIDAAAFREKMRALTFRDEMGRYWTISPQGEWYTARGKEWVQEDPPAVSPPALASAAPGVRQPAAPRPAPAPAKTRKWRWPLLGCGGLALIILVLLAYTLIAGYDDYRTSPMLVEDMGERVSVPQNAPVSSAQQVAVSERGYPDSFSILFYEEMRYETWTYYTHGSELVFENGELISETPLDLTVAELIPPPYRPEIFSANMSLEEVVAAADLDQYLLIPVEAELVEDAQVYFGDQLTFGLKDNALIFVETLALEVE